MIYNLDSTNQGFQVLGFLENTVWFGWIFLIWIFGLGHVRRVWFGFLTWVIGINENMHISIFLANFDKNSNYKIITPDLRENVIFDRNY